MSGELLSERISYSACCIGCDLEQRSRQVYTWNLCVICSQMMPWVPQNDILGHPSTKAFLSHVGANGLNEVGV